MLALWFGVPQPPLVFISLLPQVVTMGLQCTHPLCMSLSSSIISTQQNPNLGRPSTLFCTIPKQADMNRRKLPLHSLVLSLMQDNSSLNEAQYCWGISYISPVNSPPSPSYGLNSLFYWDRSLPWDIGLIPSPPVYSRPSLLWSAPLSPDTSILPCLGEQNSKFHTILRLLSLSPVCFRQEAAGAGGMVVHLSCFLALFISSSSLTSLGCPLVPQIIARRGERWKR